METIKSNKIKTYKTIPDFRQSKKWAKYLTKYGWVSYRTSTGVNIEIKPYLLWSLVKIQRPHALNQQDLHEIEEICLKHKALFIKIEPTLKQNIKLLKQNGYMPSYAPISPPSTLIIDLKKPKDVLWKEVTKSGRYGINRGRREGAIVEIYKNPNDEILKQFHDIQLEASKARHFYVQNFEDMKIKRDLFKEKAIVTMVKDLEGQINVSKFYLGYKNSVWYLHGGTANRGRKNKLGYTLIWDTLMFLKNEGYEFIDFDGVFDERFPNATKGWEGLSYFKEKFGGIRVEFPQPYVKITSNFLKYSYKFTKTIPL
ncbi:MAG: lipid II:glycine glycyltransferase FemX [Patescibacteria group bacterium]